MKVALALVSALILALVVARTAFAVDPISVLSSNVKAEGMKQLNVPLSAPATLRIENPNGPIHLFSTDGPGLFALVTEVTRTNDRKPVEFRLETYPGNRVRVAIVYPDGGTAALSVAIPPRLLGHVLFTGNDEILMEDMLVEPSGLLRIVALAPGAKRFEFRRSSALGGIAGARTDGVANCGPTLSLRSPEVADLFAFP